MIFRILIIFSALWVIITIFNFIKNFKLRNKQKKENLKNRKRNFEIMDVDFEEIE